jgi:hypothetical protein
MPRGLYLSAGGSKECQAKIYLGAVRTVDMGRPDGQLCDKIFLKISWSNLSCLRDSSGWDCTSSGRSHVRCKQFPYKASHVQTMGDERPDGWSSTRNFHIWCARVRTMIGSRPDGWSRIGNFLLWWTRVWTTAVRRLDGDIWIVILESGRDTTSSGRLIDLPFIGTWKESETIRVLRGVRTCWWNIRTDASWIEPSQHSGGSGRRDTSSGWMMLGLSGVRTVWHVVRTDGTVIDGRPDGMAR